MDNLPSDPFMLYSYINTKLRDYYSSFSELCTDMGLNMEDIEKKLNEAGFFYDSKANRFQ